MRQRKLRSGVNSQGALKQNGFKYGRKTRAGCICHSIPVLILDDDYDDDDDDDDNNNNNLSRLCICHTICTSPGTWIAFSSQSHVGGSLGITAHLSAQHVRPNQQVLRPAIWMQSTKRDVSILVTWAVTYQSLIIRTAYIIAGSSTHFKFITDSLHN